MDPELREMLAEVLRQQAEARDEQRVAAETTKSALRDLRLEMHRRLGALETAVFGGSTPPPAAPGAPPLVALPRQVSEHGEKVSEESGQRIRLEAKVDSMGILVTELAKRKGVALSVADPDTPPPSTLERLKAWIFSGESRKTAVQIGILAAAAYSAFQMQRIEHRPLPPPAAIVQPAAPSTHATNGGIVTP
jgi:hypothetical protein